LQETYTNRRTSSELRSALFVWILVFGILTLLWVAFHAGASDPRSLGNAILMGWWVLAFATGVSLYVAIRHTNSKSDKIRIHYSGPVQFNRFGFGPATGNFPQGSLGPTVVFLVFLCLLFIGFIFLLAIGHRTQLLLFNFEIFGALMGAGLIVSSIFTFDNKAALESFGITQSSRMKWLAGALRLIQFLTGLLMFAAFAEMFISDFFAERQVIEGKLDKINEAVRNFSENELFITINGVRYRALTSVPRDAKIGDRVSAELTQGSKTIVDIRLAGTTQNASLTPSPQTPRSPPVR